jgi:hypothetical protein
MGFYKIYYRDLDKINFHIKSQGISFMKILEIENNLAYLVANFDKKTFIFDVPLAHKTPKSTIKRLEGSDHDKFTCKGALVLRKKYSPNKMPEGLKKAHHALDKAIEQCYRPKPFETDEERLEYLFKMYEEMTSK